MKDLILLAFLLSILFNVAFGQSGSNVQYIYIDSVSSRYLEKDVKIDFKSSWKVDTFFNHRRSDTVNVGLNGKLFNLIEKKDSSPDFHRFGKEYLVSTNYKSGFITEIHKVRIKKLSADSILFQFILEEFKNKKQKSSKPTLIETIELWIPKNIIDGIMVKRFEMNEDK